MDDLRPRLWLLAGPNGSGKSTFYHNNLTTDAPIYVNADEIAKTLDIMDQSARDLQAMALAEQQRRNMIATGQTFAAETVFSHPSKIDLIREAKAAGYFVNLVFICTDSPDINKYRVQQRVEQGGHTVPMDKIAPRYERSLQNLRGAVLLADSTWLYDNSLAGEPHRLILKIVLGVVTHLAPELPRWITQAFPEGIHAYIENMRSQGSEGSTL